MIIDQNIREEVLDITQSFLVQAPAGSGKTSLLVQRFLSLLANVEKYPEEILAITFTRKAAAEMRGRIVDAIKLAQHGIAPTDDYSLKLWQLGRAVLQRDKVENWDLIDNPTRLKIQTIDALCSSIAAQMPITAQFGSKPQIEPNSQYLYIKAVEQFLQDTGKDSAWQVDINTLLIHLDNDRAKVITLLTKMLEVRDQWLPIVYGTLEQHSMRTVLQHALQQVVTHSLENIIENIPEVLDFSILGKDMPESIIEWLSIAELLLTKDEQWRKAVTAKQGFPAQKDATNKEERAAFKARKDAMEFILEELHSNAVFKQQLIAITKLPPVQYTEQQWKILESLYNILKILVAQLTLVFKETGLVDFSSVNMAALLALDANDVKSDLSLALDCKIQHILVDEFQDTSHSQFSMLQKLTATWEPRSGKTLFLVGDPMQSIYRFRKAEVSLFLRAKLYGINYVTLKFVQLKVNFRSTAKMVNWFNRVFTNSFPDKDDMDYGAISYMPSQAAAPDSNDAEIKSPAHCFAVAGAQEAAKIIEIINNVKSSDPSRSVAILVRARTHLVKIIPALRAANICYQAVELESMQRSQLIQDLLALTKAILHLDDRIAWLAVLRAPWSGLCLIDLNIIAQHQQTVWHAIQQSEVLDTISHDAVLRLSRIIVCIQQALQQLGRVAIDILIYDLWQALGGNLYANSDADTLEMETYFKFLAKHATERDLYVPDYLEQQLSDLYLYDPNVDKNAVQIMTMHKSKGLEFDVVILPGLGNRLRNDEHKLLLLEQRTFPQEFIIMAPIKATSEEHDQIYNYVKWCEQQRHQYETLRSLYVAITRAREELYCLGAVGNKGPVDNSLLARLWSVLEHDFQFIKQIADSCVETTTKASQSISRINSTWYADNPVMLTQQKLLQLETITWQSDWLRIVGIVIHRVLWQIVQDGINTWNTGKVQQQLPLWKQNLRQLGLESLLIDNALEMVQKAINNTLNDQFAKNILSNQHLESYNEWQLTVLQHGETKKIILDRAFLDAAGKFWIVDYKLVQQQDDIPAAVQKYGAQLQKYTKAVRALRPELSITAGLYFPLQARWEMVI